MCSECVQRVCSARAVLQCACSVRAARRMRASKSHLRVGLYVMELLGPALRAQDDDLVWLVVRELHEREVRRGVHCRREEGFVHRVEHAHHHVGEGGGDVRGGKHVGFESLALGEESDQIVNCLALVPGVFDPAENNAA